MLYRKRSFLPQHRGQHHRCQTNLCCHGKSSRGMPKSSNLTAVHYNVGANATNVLGQGTLLLKKKKAANKLGKDFGFEPIAFKQSWKMNHPGNLFLSQPGAK